MAFTEKYVKVASPAWVNATVYALDAQVLGSDSKNYYCILAHTSETGVKGRPTDGTDWATYWAVSDGTTEARAWTFAEMIAAAPAAETRVNIKAGSYSEGATVLPSNGTVAAPIVLRGYNSSIGDLDNLGRSSDGTLNTANMPDITITSAWTPSASCFLQNLDLTGALSSYLITSATIDNWGMVSCRLVNSQNNASAGCAQGDDYLWFINCDLSCTGASHAVVLDADNYVSVYGCRFVITLNTGVACQLQHGNVSRSCFIGTSNTSVAIKIVTAIGTAQSIISSNTIYNFGTAIQLPNAASVSFIPVLDNHITDCGKYIDNLYSGTAYVSALELNNRTRDNTTPRTGIVSIVLAGEVTTDAGDYLTDYVSATDLRLIYGAAGVAEGMMPDTDIGAYQRARPTLPADEDVQDGVSYGDGGTQYEGDLVLPTEAQVELGVQFGGDGTEFEGTLAGGAGGILIHQGMTGGMRA